MKRFDLQDVRPLSYDVHYYASAIKSVLTHYTKRSNLIGYATLDEDDTLIRLWVGNLCIRWYDLTEYPELLLEDYENNYRYLVDNMLYSLGKAMASAGIRLVVLTDPYDKVNFTPCTVKRHTISDYDLYKLYRKRFEEVDWSDKKVVVDLKLLLNDFGVKLLSFLEESFNNCYTDWSQLLTVILKNNLIPYTITEATAFVNRVFGMYDMEFKTKDSKPDLLGYITSNGLLDMVKKDKE